MAPRAPRPGTTPSTTQDDDVALGFQIEMNGETLVLNFADIGAVDDEIFESQTKKTLTDVLNKLDHPPNLAALVWFARRKRGERKLTYREVLKRFPGRVELGEMFTDGRFDIDVITSEEPEDSDADPLPSDGG